MAPSRRKGAGKAAVAAASRRQWKVGDLVLAKVKGFPAWPATVSEPEKWGYSADWKKVLVYFFGTQQIAFCNPADVEAFTEEKKQSLLIKRQGKGADFVRAVQEIIDCHEKLKECDNNDIMSCDDVARANGGSVVDSSTNIGPKDETEAPVANNDNLQSNTSLSSRGTSEPVPLNFASASAQGSSLLHREALQDEPTDAAVTEQPFPPSTTSRKRSGGSRLKSSIRRNLAVVQRSRSSSRVGSRRLQHLAMPLNVGDTVDNHIPEESLKRSKRNRKSSDGSDCDDATSEALISNVSIEDNASEIVTADSDTYSLNECSTIDSDCKFEHTETAVECLEGKVGLGKGLGLHIKAIVIKKKRKPNRKRVVNGASDDHGARDKHDILEVVVDDSNQCSKTDCEKSTEGCSKEDGDEHLPLVKRARVRMSKLSSSEELKKHSDSEEQNLKEVTVNLAGKISDNSNSADDGSSNRDLHKVNGAFDYSSPSKACTQFSGNQSQLCTFKKDQPFFSVDGEAVLPPSKRLHRALEAMSANVAEEDQAAETVMSMRTSINGFLLNSMCISSPLPTENKEHNDLGLHGGTCSHNSLSLLEAQGFSTGYDHNITVEHSKTSLEVDFGPQGDQNHKIQQRDSQDDVLVDSGDHASITDRSDSELGCNAAGMMVHVGSVKEGFPSGERADIKLDGVTEDQLLSSEDQGKGNDPVPSFVKSGNPVELCESSENDGMVCGIVSDVNGNGKLSHQGKSDLVKCGADDSSYRVTESSKSASVDRREDNNMFDVKDVNDRQLLNDQACSSVDHVVEKDASETRSSLSVASMGNSLVPASPAHTSVGHASTSDSCSHVRNNSSCSPDTNLSHKKSLGPIVKEVKPEPAVIPKLKPISKDAEAYAALSSFETMLGNLTRTKDSIGRATRVAIDCAKFGLGRKVVDVLTRTLDMESSLHKKLDLFFLIDSITQSSQNLKGNVAGIYPPAIQLVLSRLLSAVAPPGITAQENRKQCIKVLRLWSQRGVLPESVIRKHMRELESLSGSSSVGAYARRSSRTERSLDDPLREMEGMLVDEYGSNSSFQMPGFCMPRMLKDEEEGSDSDGGSFEAVTPEHESQACEELETAPVLEKRRHILEDVDGELEMEDVAPHEVEMSSCSTVVVNTAEPLPNKFEKHFSLPMGPPLPQDMPPSSPPLPSSPPPPPPPLPLSFTANDSHVNDFELEHYMEANNAQDNSIQSVTPPPNVPGMNQRANDASRYPSSECRDLQMQMPESTSRSFCNFSAPGLNDAPRDDATTSHKGYPLRPPYPAPQDQFTYVQGDHRMKPRWDGPPAYSSRFRFGEDADGENFYDNHERMRPYSYEQHDNWRIPRPFYGSRYHDRGRTSYGPASCGAPCEPTRLHSQRWRFPSRDMNSRNSMPYRQPYEGPVRVSSRGPGFWRPR